MAEKLADMDVDDIKSVLREWIQDHPEAAEELMEKLEEVI
tara:strand:+ start:180 stop:299 length:120 start_codon:yes stop_codon:yes gene_type:complete